MKRAWGVALTWWVLSGCFFLPSEEYACKNNTDCAGLVGATCNVDRGVCERGAVAGNSSGQTGESSSQAGGAGGSGTTSSGTPTSSGSTGVGSSSGRVPSSMGPVNLPPVVGELELNVDPGATAVGQLTATDPEGTAVTFALQTGALQGTATVTPLGEVSYVAAATGIGEDAFLVQASDAMGATASARVNVRFSRTYMATKTWVGGSPAGPTSWADPANWSPAGAPVTQDDVLIPANTANRPVLVANTNVRNLQLDEGAVLNLATFTLGVSADVYSYGAMQATGGKLRMATNFGRILGNLPNLEVAGQVRVLGLTNVQGDVLITPNVARLELGTSRMTVTGEFVVRDLGAFTMVNTAARLTVEGRAYLAGTSPAGGHTAGTLELRGNVETSGQGLRAAGEHVTILSATQPILFLVGGNETRFARLRIQGAPVSMNISNGNALDVGRLDIVAPVAVTMTGVDLTVTGPVQTVAASTLAADTLTLQDPTGTDGMYGALAVPELILEGQQQPVVAGLQYQDITVNGRAVVRDGVVLTGTLRVEGTNTRAEVSGTVDVGGNVETWGGGALGMVRPTDMLTVAGDVRLEGSSGNADLTDGTLVVRGDLYGRFEGMLPGVNHRIVLAGTRTQTISMEGSGVQGNNARARHLDVDNAMGVVVDRDFSVSGQLRLLQGNLTGNTGTNLDVGWQPGGGLTTAANTQLAVGQLDLHESVGTTLMAGSFGAAPATLVYLHGDGQALAAVTGGYPAVRIMASDVTLADGLEVLGDLTLEGGNTTARLLGPLVVDGVLLCSSGSELDLAGQDLTAQTLRFEFGSPFVMTAGALNLTDLLISQSPSTITGGRLMLRGNLTVTNASFWPTAANRLVLSGNGPSLITLFDSVGPNNSSALGPTDVVPGKTVTLMSNVYLAESMTLGGSVMSSPGATLVVPSGVTLRVAVGKALLLQPGSTLDVQGTVEGTCTNMGGGATITGAGTHTCQ